MGQGVTFEEVVTRTQEFINRAKIFFGLQSITNLANNGRVNKTVAKLAQVLNINVLGCANESGEIEQLGKARGVKKARQNLLALLEKHNFDGQKLVIDHVDNQVGAEALKELVLKNTQLVKLKLENVMLFVAFMLKTVA